MTVTLNAAYVSGDTVIVTAKYTGYDGSAVEFEEIAIDLQQ